MAKTSPRKKKTRSRKATPAAPARKRRPSNIVQVMKRTPPAVSQPCRTCMDAGWVKAIRDALDSMLRYDPQTEAGLEELPLSTTVPHILRVMKHQAKALGIKSYPYSISAIKRHIQKCEEERWHAVEEKRAQAV